MFNLEDAFSAYLSRHRLRRRVLPLVSGLGAVACLAFGVSTATAAVQVDPGGPAGQQYALPLDSVRGESAGNPSVGVPGAPTAAPLFGQGIRPVDEAGDGKTSKNDSGGNGKDDPNGTGKGVDGSNLTGVDAADTGPKVEALISGTGGESSTTLEMILLIGGMALIGLTAGLIGRRTL